MSPALDLTRDCFRFVLTFFDVISMSAPHIYISALPLSPKSSIVRNLYNKYACPSFRIVRGLPTSWDPGFAAVYRGDFRGVAAWSPSSKFIAVTTSATIEILDAATLERLATLDSPQNTTNRQLCFSPDGRTLTQFHRGKLASWDLQTGGPLGSLLSEEWNARLEDSFSLAYSVDGNILAVSGVSSRYPSLIDTYHLLSGAHMSSRASEGRIVTPIWTHGDYLRFVILKPGSITMWETPFTSVHTPAMVESLPTPGEVADIKDENSLFLPTLSRLAFTTRGMILVWDARIARFLLKFPPTPTSRPTKVCKMSFSSDGRFFAHTTADQEVYVWKESLTSYAIHQKLAFPSGQMDPLLSPNGESIIAVGSSTIHLWRTTDQILSSPYISAPENGGRSILGFSPDQVLAASATFGGRIVTILDLQSGDLRLTIDAGMEVRCLGMTESTIAVAGRGEIVTWDLPSGACVNTKVDIKGSVRTVILDRSGAALPDPRSISTDFSRIAITGYSKANSDMGKSEAGVAELLIPHLQIHGMSDGKQLAGIRVSHLPEWIALGECEVWCMGRRGSVEGWKIVEDNKSGISKLESLEATGRQSRVFPWQSRCGYEVINEWVFSPDQKRLVWLPHHWRSQEDSRTWSGQFLGLGHGELSEVVILEFFE